MADVSILSRPEKRALRKHRIRWKRLLKRLYNKLGSVFRRRKSGGSLSPRIRRNLSNPAELLENRIFLSGTSNLEDFYHTQVDTEFSNPTSVLSNDSVPNWENHDSILVTGPAYGTVVLDLDGFFTYTPDYGYVGVDQFTYSYTDGTTPSSPIKVEIDVGDSPGQKISDARELIVLDGDDHMYYGTIGDSSYGNHDVDLYSVNLEEGDRVVIEAFVINDPGYGGSGYGGSGYGGSGYGGSGYGGSGYGYGGYGGSGYAYGGYGATSGNNLTLDTYLRVFDTAGNELLSNDDANAYGSYGYGTFENYLYANNSPGTNSALSFIANTTGAYAIGVSSFGNHFYNPITGAFTFTSDNGKYGLRVYRESERSACRNR